MRKAFLLLVVFITTIFFSACTQTEQTLRIAINPWPGYKYFYLAEELGYFTDEKVKVELVPFYSLADSRRAFELGQVDGWCTTIVEILLSHFHTNKKSRLLWVTNISHGSDILLAHESVKTVSQLKGKTIGVEPATVDIVLLHGALQNAGLDMKSVKIKHLRHGEMKSAIANRSVDAVTIYPPESIEIEAMSDVHRIFDSSNMPEVILDVLSVSEERFKGHEKQWLAVGRALKKAIGYEKQHPDQSMKIVSLKTGIEESELRKLEQGIIMLGNEEQKRFLRKGDLLEKSLSEVSKALRESGLKVESVPVTELVSDLLVD